MLCRSGAGAAALGGRSVIAVLPSVSRRPPRSWHRTRVLQGGGLLSRTPPARAGAASRKGWPLHARLLARKLDSGALPPPPPHLQPPRVACPPGPVRPPLPPQGAGSAAARCTRGLTPQSWSQSCRLLPREQGASCSGEVAASRAAD